MKQLLILFSFVVLCSFSCNNENIDYNKSTSGKEQQRTEQNQERLLNNQPPPIIDWSMERESLIDRFLMMNDQTILFYMYIFNYGIKEPIGYYTVKKVSSVNSQLTNPEQIVAVDANGYDNAGVDEQHHLVLPSPAEDGSYGTNGNGVFSFTPDRIYIEHNMQYIVSSVPLPFDKAPHLVQINAEDMRTYNQLLDKIEKVKSQLIKNQ